MVKGWALCRRGEVTGGLGYFHEGLKNWRARGARLVIPGLLLLQAECYESAGQIDALASVDEGLALSDSIEDGYTTPLSTGSKGNCYAKQTERAGWGLE